MKHLLKLLFFFSLAFTLPAFALENSATDTVYTEQKTGIFVTMDHPEFVIKLKSNPTTGYSWFVKEYDSQYLEAVKHSYQTGEQQLIGSPGYEYWTFKVKPEAFSVPRQVSLSFVYARPWEKGDHTPSVTFWISTQGKN